MEYRLGNAKKINPLGATTPLVCPHCKREVTFSVFSNAEVRLVPDFPLIENGKVYFLVCPACAAVYGIEEHIGNLFKKGEPLAIGNFDFKELKTFHV